MSELRSLLLTDVVDSTRLARELGDVAAAALWATHDRLARDLLPARRGREIDKADGLLLLFETMVGAVDYALAYQRALATLTPPLRARAGLHAGPVTLRENSPADVARGAKPLEVEGLAKATAARVMSIALGGQILLSAPARQALGEQLGLRMQSHGHWRLKGLDEPVELFELADADRSFATPPDADKAYRVVRQGTLWLPVREVRHSLPAERDAFVGRAAALAELSRHAQSGARLVSVLGLGGTGKTRLVTRFGWSWLGDFPGGVWFCDLVAARGVDGIVYAVAQGLDVPLGGGDPVTQLGHAIAGRGPCLVILDNFEQVARHAAQTLGPWLDRASKACFMVTTREVLGLAGEQVLALAPLPHAEGEALFMQRAVAAAPGFRATAEDQAAITPLVDLLDGLPLAIELAAARVRLMSPRMLLQRMGERFKLLTSSGNRVDRQATLRATLDWSWDLLHSAERAALAQLSVFEGGFTLESAEAVLDLTAIAAAPWVVDVIGSLVDKSLVRPRGADRFDLLVTVHVYAAERLQQDALHVGSGQQALTAAQRRHVDWFAGLGPVRATEGRCEELDNLVVACRRAVALAEGDLAAGALEGAAAALGRRGPYDAGVSLGEAVCAIPGLQGRAAANALRILSGFHLNCRRPDLARALQAQALEHAVAADDRLCLARLSALMAMQLLREGKPDEGKTESRQTIALARSLGDRRVEGRAQLTLGALEVRTGHFTAAQESFSRALALAAELGDLRMRGGILHSLSALLGQLGHQDQAIDSLEEALAIAREADDRLGQGDALGSLGWSYFLQGRHEESLKTSMSALELQRELGSVQKQGTSLCNLAIARVALGQTEQAQADFEGAIAIAREIGDKHYEGQYLAYFALLQAQQGRHDQAMNCLDRGETLLRETSDPLALGALLCNRAEVLYRAGDAAAANTALAEASTIAAEFGAAPTSELGVGLARVAALINPG